MLWYPIWALQPFLPGSYIISIWHYDHWWRADMSVLIHITQIKIPMYSSAMDQKFCTVQHKSQMDFNKEFEDDLKIVKQFSFLSWPNDDGCSCTFSPELSGLYNLVRRSNDNHRPWPLIMLFVSVYLKSKCCVANRFAQSIILTNRKTDVGFWFLWVLIKTQTEDKHDVTQLIAQKAQSK